MDQRKSLLLTLILLLGSTSVNADSHPNMPVVLESGQQRVELLELYTSEGCSSCPPAEAWLSGLKNDPGLWKKFVPVSFHVDYWNSLGWPDAYSSPQYTARQRAYADAWNSPSIYTPEFVLNGREWHPMLGSIPPSENQTGRLRAEIGSDGKVEIAYQPLGKKQGRYIVEMALLVDGVTTKVRRGENAGRELTHDFLVLNLQRAELHATATGEYTGSLTLPTQRVAAMEAMEAIALWVRSEENLTPLQSLGGWLQHSP